MADKTIDELPEPPKPPVKEAAPKAVFEERKPPVEAIVKSKDLEEKENILKSEEERLAEEKQKLLEEKHLIEKEREQLELDKKALTAEEDPILEKIRIMEEDKRIISEKEDEIEKSIEMLEKEKKLIEEKDDEILGAADKIDEERKEIVKKLKAIQQLEKEHEKRLDKLQEREIQIADKEARLENDLSVVAQYKKYADEIKELEKIHKNVMKKVNDGYKQLEKLYKDKEEIEKSGIIRINKKLASSGEIPAMIEMAKGLIERGRIEEANAKVEFLLQMYKRLKDDHPRRKEIYYDIIALKNEIKLALIE